MAKKKLLLIAGHGEGDPGACSKWGQEADYTRELATMVKRAVGNKMLVTMYDQTKNCYEQSKKGNVPAYADYDMTLEVHFNAKAKKDPDGDGRYTGVGGYIHPENAGRAVARAIIDKVAGLGFKEWLLADSTGLLNLNNAQRQGAKYFLLETAFIDDGDDMNFYSERKGAFATAIAQGLMDGLGMKSAADEVTTPEYWRVRMAWEDEKSQLYAMGTEAAAIAACPAGYRVYDPSGKCVYTAPGKEPGKDAGSEPVSKTEPPYLVETTCDWLWIRAEPRADAAIEGSIQEEEGKKNLYTIVKESDGWGLLKSRIGWICLDYTKRV